MENKNIIIDSSTNILKIKNDTNYSFETIKNSNSNIFIYIENEYSGVIDFKIEESSNLNITLISKSNKDINFNFYLSDSSTLNLFSTDKIVNSISVNKNFYLNGDNSILNQYIFTSLKNIDATSNVNIYHNALNTKAESKVYLLSRGKSKLIQSVTAYIKKNMTGSVSNELIKGIILSSDSIIEAKPVLVVDDDDVKANHGCAIGTIDQNEIYYLMSRGLSYEDALKIISKSLVTPIINSIKDESLKEELNPFFNDLIGE